MTLRRITPHPLAEPTADWQSLGLRSTRLLSLAFVIVLTGCQSGAPEPVADDAADVPEGPTYLFYPPLPDSPRFQHLKTFSSSREFDNPGEGPEEERPQSSLNRFLFGEVQRQREVRYFLPDKPFGVDIHDGKIYLVDLRGDMYIIYDLVNWAYREVVPKEAGHLRQPANLTIDEDGTKYVCDSQRSEVVVFGPDERFVRAIALEGGGRPGDTAIDGNRLFITDVKEGRIHVLDKNTLELLYKIPSEESGASMGFPTSMYIRDGVLYVTEAKQFRVLKFKLDGEFIDGFGEIGDWPGSFARPKGLAVDRDGRILVVDAAFERIQVFDDQHRLLLAFPNRGDGNAALSLPIDIAIDYDNVDYFRQYAHEDFELEYLVLVSNQVGDNKVNVFGYGRMAGMDYPEDSSIEDGRN